MRKLSRRKIKKDIEPNKANPKTKQNEQNYRFKEK